VAKFVVLARAEDGSASVTVGPVASVGAVMALAAEITAAGWVPQGVRQLWSVAQFRDRAASARNRRPGQ
jgi:hypothetical protein